MKMADKIVHKFGVHALRIIEEEPERLAEIKGISMAKAMDISSQMEEKKDMRSVMMYLQKFGITTALALKIYKQYGNKVSQVLEANPYRLAEEVNGIGFRIADEIARKIGFLTDSDFRIQSGISYALLQSSNEGHTYLPKDLLYHRTCQLLGLTAFDIDQQLMDLCIQKKVVVKKVEEEQYVYASTYYYTELNVARMLLDLRVVSDEQEGAVMRQIVRIEKELEMELEQQQKNAIYEAANNGILVITGGPGTGKTTTINAIIKYFEAMGNEIRLAAPTGRAAKRMTETTGYEAQTIHRLLELSGAMEEGETMQFERNEMNPLEVDVLIIDEMSMVDIFLMHALLRAVAAGTKLILVGDVDQLPSVGAGNVLKDIISSECFPVVKLEKIFRQASQSDIVTNAHRINHGEMIDLGKYSEDFLFIKRDDASRIAGVIVTLIREKLPKYVNASVTEIQVLSPMKKGNLGVISLNRILQQELNPPDSKKREHEHGDMVFREGDKVMQIKNNYQLEWEKRGKYGIVTERGVGVFNGDMGTIRVINPSTELMEVEFDDNRFAIYSFKDLEELELAYAVTVHKSQGSEYPAVIIPVLSGPAMLMNRNILYTAVTRAKKCVCLVGMPQTVQMMIENEGEHKRFCSLHLRLREQQEEGMNIWNDAN
jgi:exodeoxyribonuclease V alpha subunit